MGEAYEAQEKGLCWGLAERLGRNDDLQPYEYKQPRQDRSDPLEPVPDRVYYHRVAGSSSHSPVIPFYWGFREKDDRINKTEARAHGEWLDGCGNRIDKDGAKGGGPFPNACNCLPHMWAGGWKPTGVVPVANLFTSPTHRLNRPAPDRRYQVLAALRLAMVIRILRKRHPHVAVNVVAHSMGCLVALLAQAFLMDGGDAPADSLVLNNPPYSFEENRQDEWAFEGMNQTTGARVETLKRIVKAFHHRRARTPDWTLVTRQAAEKGLAWAPWTQSRKKATRTGEPVAFLERDNRGRIHLYFTPHDRTVSLCNTLGIGWQGIPDTLKATWLEEARPGGSRGPDEGLGALFDHSRLRSASWPTLLADLEASGFRQRLFMQQQRKGETYRVGLPRERVPLLQKGDNYPKPIPDLLARGSLSPDMVRTINGEPLAPPIHFEPGQATSTISPIDACVALTEGGDGISAPSRWMTRALRRSASR